MEFNTQEWQALEIRDVDVLSKPIVLRSQTLPARHIFPVHAHHWHLSGDGREHLVCNLA